MRDFAIDWKSKRLTWLHRGNHSITFRHIHRHLFLALQSSEILRGNDVVA